MCNKTSLFLFDKNICNVSARRSSNVSIVPDQCVYHSPAGIIRCAFKADCMNILQVHEEFLLQ